MFKYLALSLLLCVILTSSNVSAQDNLQLSSEELNSINLIQQLSSIKSQVWSIALKVYKGVDATTAADIKKIASKIVPFLKSYNISINVPLRLNASACKSDAFALLNQARNLFTTCPYKLDKFKENLKQALVVLGQLIFDCTGVNILPDLALENPSIQLNFFGVAKCAKSLVFQAPALYSMVSGIASITTLNIPVVFDAVKRISPTVKLILADCDLGIILNDPSGDQRATQDACLKSISDVKAGIPKVVEILKNWRNIFKFTESVETVVGLVNPVLKNCGAFAK